MTFDRTVTVGEFLSSAMSVYAYDTPSASKDKPWAVVSIDLSGTGREGYLGRANVGMAVYDPDKLRQMAAALTEAADWMEAQ